MALHSSSYESMYEEPGSKPPKREGAGLVAILLVVAVAVIAVLFIPSLRARINKFFPSHVPKKVVMSAKVWADKQAGSYYCADSKFFGRGAGTYMNQGDALTLGYQPALGDYCQGNYPKHFKALDDPARSAGHSTGSEAGSR